MNIEEVAMFMSDREYFAQRIAAERASARAAASREIGEIHLRLARAYEARLSDVADASESPRYAPANSRRSLGQAS
jgi:hypothetical protein